MSCCLLGLPGLWAPSNPLDTDQPGPGLGIAGPAVQAKEGFLRLPAGATVTAGAGFLSLLLKIVLEEGSGQA